jgi:hypothetical protein
MLRRVRPHRFASASLAALTSIALVGLIVAGAGPVSRQPWVVAAGLPFVTLAFGAWLTRQVGSEAVHQQFAREARVQVKRDVYQPLEVEVRTLLSRLDDGLNRVSPLPAWIDLGGWPLPDGFMTMPKAAIAFRLWPAWRDNSERTAFSNEAVSELNSVMAAASAYDSASTSLYEQAPDLVEPHLERALDQVKQSGEFARWQRDNVSNGQITLVKMTDEDRLYHNVLTWWNGDIRKQAEQWAVSLVGDGALQVGRNMIGWMLLGDYEQAAGEVRWGHPFGEQLVPTQWLAPVLESASHQLLQLESVARPCRRLLGLRLTSSIWKGYTR